MKDSSFLISIYGEYKVFLNESRITFTWFKAKITLLTFKKYLKKIINYNEQN